MKMCTMALAFLFFAQIAQAELAIVDESDMCTTPLRKFTDGISNGQNGSEAEYTVKPGKRKMLGSASGVEVWLAERSVTSEDQSLFFGSAHCYNLEYMWKGKLKLVALHSDGWLPSDGQYFKSAKIDAKGRIRLVISVDYKTEPVGTENTILYKLLPEKGELSQVGEVASTSPSEKEDTAINTLFEKKKFKQGFALLKKSDRDPTGQGIDSTSMYLAETSRTLFPYLKKLPAKERAKMASDYLAALAWPTEPKVKDVNASHLKAFSSPGIGYWLNLRDSRELTPALVPLVNDLAFFLGANGPTPDALLLLKWVIEAAPGRAVAHLNYADLLWAQGNKVEALKHYEVYRQQMLAFAPSRTLALRAKIRAALRAEAVLFTPEEKKNWLGFSVIEIMGKRVVNFQEPPMVPVKWSRAQLNEKGEENSYFDNGEAFFSIDGPLAIQGLLVDPKQAVSFRGKDRHLGAAVLAAPAVLSGVRCAAGHFRRDSDFECTLDSDQTIGGFSLAGGTELKLDSAGEPFEFTLKEGSPYSGFGLKAGEKVFIRTAMKKDAFVSFAIANPIELPEIKIPAGATLNLNCELGIEVMKPEQLTNCAFNISTPKIVTVRGWKFFHTVSLRKGFKVEGGYLVKDWQGKSGFCAKGNFLTNYEEANPKLFICHDPFGVNGKIPAE